MTAVQELNELCAQLPAEKTATLLEFARFLAEKADDNRWDQRLEAAADSPKFRALVASADEAIARGEAEPLDIDKL
jgi:hypothetical protein